MDIIIPMEDVLLSPGTVMLYKLLAPVMAAEIKKHGAKKVTDETFRLKSDGSGEIFVEAEDGFEFVFPVPKGEFIVREYPMSN